MPSHCGIPGNERADALAGEAAALPQEEVPLDTRTVFRAAARVARARTAQQPSRVVPDPDGEAGRPRCLESTATQPPTYTS